MACIQVHSILKEAPTNPRELKGHGDVKRIGQEGNAFAGRSAHPPESMQCTHVHVLKDEFGGARQQQSQLVRVLGNGEIQIGDHVIADRVQVEELLQ